MQKVITSSGGVLIIACGPCFRSLRAGVNGRMKAADLSAVRDRENNIRYLVMEAQKASPGGFAITAFIGSAIYLVMVNYGWQTLLTIKTVIFLLLGVFFSVLLVGVPFYLLGGWIQKRFFGHAEVPVSPAVLSQLRAVSTVLMMVQVVVTFYATKFAYDWYFS
jgi:hypothetical protein